ncbi:hypothetical protein UPYG_G00243000 [Umbra pygmaea]|uniref:Tetratricopeptide repeat protein 31 n=1 Tax=Umbra pygmaea TaxID=75934 RepID=A0ABD0X3J2_UMBPY
MSGRKFANARAVKPGPRDHHMMPPVMEFVTVNSLGQHFGFLGFDYPIPDCCHMVEFEEHHSRKSCRGFSRNVLEASSSSYQRPSYQTRRRYSPPPTPKPNPVDCAAKAAELLAEEEKAKEKAEKRRIKRSKQKERKRLEKLNKEQQNPVKNAKVNNVDPEESKSVNEKSNKTSASKEEIRAPPPQYWSDTSSSECSSEEDDEDEDDDVYISSEELDMTSSFVSKAAEIAARKLQQNATRECKQGEKKQSANDQLKEKPKEEQKDVQEVSSPLTSIEYIIQRSKELAVTGNEFAAIGRYDVAVKYFTAAIKCNPTDFRLFCNRAFCYEKLQQYDKALADAELALSMSPQWLKGLFRKARALAGLKRYDEAVKALHAVLKQDPSSVDAAKELMTVQITQLMGLGFSREQSSNALIIHGTVEESLKALSKISGSLNMSGYPAVAQPVAVGGAHNSSRAVPPSASPRPQQVPQRFYNNTTQPHTPMSVSNNRHDEIKLYPIWVGNLVPSVTEATIKKLFEGAGHIHSMKILWDKRCAFINYIDPDCCENARTLHGRELDGAKISVRYPDRNPTHLGIAKDAQKAEDLPVINSRECFFWRNMGCNRRPSCPYRHIPEHHGVDRGKGKSSAQ